MTATFPALPDPAPSLINEHRTPLKLSKQVNRMGWDEEKGGGLIALDRPLFVFSQLSAISRHVSLLAEQQGVELCGSEFLRVNLQLLFFFLFGH